MVSMTGGLAVDDPPVALVSLDASRHAPGEVMLIWIAIVAAVAIVRIWWRRWWCRVIRLEVGDMSKVDDDPVSKSVFMA